MSTLETTLSTELQKLADLIADRQRELVAQKDGLDETEDTDEIEACDQEVDDLETLLDEVNNFLNR